MSEDLPYLRRACLLLESRRSNQHVGVRFVYLLVKSASQRNAVNEYLKETRT